MVGSVAPTRPVSCGEAVLFDRSTSIRMSFVDVGGAVVVSHPTARAATRARESRRSMGLGGFRRDWRVSMMEAGGYTLEAACRSGWSAGEPLRALGPLTCVGP
jgi:hypothetical protein